MKTDTTIFGNAIALNFAEGETPDWVQLLPEGEAIRGADGRSWTMKDAPALIEGFRKRSIQLPIDVEHSTQVKGARGEEAPAVGWISDLEARNNGLWGKVSWNERGRELLSSKSYRYLSPVFSFAKTSGAITRMVSAGLTNNPNLDLVALNRESAEQEESMDPELIEALGLNSDATTADAVAAIDKLKAAEATARNRAETPDLTKFVPRADYDLAMNRVKDFEKAEKDREDEAINTAVDAAVEAGKITPANKDFYIAACRAEGGLEKFQTMIDAAPVIGEETGLGDKSPEAKNSAKLSADELAVCQQMGMSAEEFEKLKSEDQD